MGEEQAAAAQPTTSLAELNKQHADTRANVLNVALQKALQSKGEPAPKPGKTAKPAAAPAAPVAASPEASAASAPDDSASDPSTAAAADSADEPAATDQADEPATAPELSKLQELGKKKDLRALEKELGLEEGHLGVNNGSWVAYRHRIEELEGREATHARNEQTLIQRFGPAAALTERANKGDLKAYASLIESTTQVPIDQFIAFWAKNVTQIDPETLRLRRENEELRRGGRLVNQDGSVDKPQPVTAQAAQKKADDYIASEAGQHPAFKLEGAKDGVRKLWLESYDPKTRGMKLTPQQAAGEFVKQRKAAYEREQWILSGKKPPTAPRTKVLSRRGASETQVRPENLTREQLVERAAKEWQRLKARGEAT